MKTRLAGPPDAGAIAALMRGSFDRATLDLTIYGCSGIARYLEARMQAPVELCDCRHLLAMTDLRPTGFAELRMLPDAVCLNYIALAAERRGRRDGDRLLSHALDTMCDERHRHVVLDVFASNHIASAWYRRLGFEAEHETVWWSLPTDHDRHPVCRKAGRVGDSAGACRIDGLPEAEACEQAYGFSRFQLETPRASYCIGRLAGRWFRTDDPRLLDDAPAVACLAMLDPSRRILARFPSDFNIDKYRRAQRLDRSARLHADLERLRRRLSERIGT